MTLQITHSGQAYNLPKEFILKELSQSILADALQLDPEVTTLTLDHPDVKPSVLALLVQLSEGKEPVEHLPELKQTHRYLNVPTLLGYAEPLYDKFTNRKDWWSRDNEYAHERIIIADCIELWEHLCRKGTPLTRDDIPRFFQQALRVDAVQIAAKLLPVAEVTTNILLCMTPSSPRCFRLLLKDSRIQPTDELFQYVVDAKLPTFVQMLLEDGRVDPNAYGGAFLRLATEKQDYATIQLLLADPRVKPQQYGFHPIDTAIHQKDFTAIQLYIQDGRVNLTRFQNALLRVAAKEGEVKLVKQLLEDAEVRKDTAYAIFFAIQHKHVEVLDLLLPHRQGFPYDEIIRLAFHTIRIQECPDETKLLQVLLRYEPSPAEIYANFVHIDTFPGNYGSMSINESNYHQLKAIFQITPAAMAAAIIVTKLRGSEYHATPVTVWRTIWRYETPTTCQAIRAVLIQEGHPDLASLIP